MAKRLTPATLATKAPASGRIEVRDSDSPLVFRVTHKNGRSLSVRTRLHGEQIRFTYPRAVIAENLGDARQWALAVVDRCKAGVDPREERKQQLAEAVRQRKHTFGAVAEEFIADHVAKLRDRKHTEAEIRRLLLGQTWKPWDAERIKRARAEADAGTGEWVDDARNPGWRDRPIASITDDDVAERVREIQKQNSPHVARRVLAYTKMLFAWAAAPGRPGRLKSNPCAMLSAKKHFGIELAKRQVALSNDHMRLVWKAAAKLNEPFGAFFKMLLLSGQRRGEAAGMTWSELDLDGEKVWSIPAGRMKAKRPHLVPLSGDMVTLLKRLKESRGKGDFVFSTTLGKRPISGFSKIKVALDKAVSELQKEEMAEARKNGLDVPVTELPDWAIHDIRRTVRTGLGAIPSIPHDVRELVIAHVPPALVQTYDLHSYVAEKRQALDLWAQRLANVVKAPPAGENVVALPAKKPARAAE